MNKRKTLISIIVISILALLPFAVSAQITNSITIYSESDLAAYGWPVTISGGTSENPVMVTLAADITLSDASNYFIIGSDFVTFDGNNRTVTITGSISNYLGLIQNGSSYAPVTNGYSNITIKNIVVSTPDAILNTFAGWIGQESFGLNATNVTIDNCSSNGPQTYSGGGGIVGRKSPAIVTNCYSTGAIAGSGGGICGSGFSGTVVNCYSTGAIGGGGIVGNSCSGKVINCYSTGNIASSAGGIMGSGASGQASNCYSTGVIGLNAGGIMGSNTTNTATATNCYSIGTIGTNGGGIMGAGSSSTNYSAGNVTNCYSTGSIGLRGGGIVGRYSSGNITNCYTIGNLGTNAGGIMGYLSTNAISNCFSSYSDIWNDSDASSVLTGTNGSVWIGFGSGIPFTLAPYTSSIITTTNFGSFTTYSGVPSDSQTIMVSGTSLLSDITISVPTGYELATSPTGTFSSSLSLSPTAETLDDTTLYVRLTNDVVNGAIGTITVASTGCTTQNMATGIAVLQPASANIYGSKTIGRTTRINRNGAIGVSGVSSNGKIIYYLPSLSATSVVTAISANTAVSGGTILSNGGSAITASGVCWSSYANPTTADSKTSDGTALSFTSNLTGLTTGATYYVRAYATNNEGTSYGTGVSFTAL